eukprot:CAMPEP_0179456592 /NCGR_PEP_ID=MMETSP0799-20121207/40484_1 /TAXON_ID=46947 /ORGANISM="Geminigera cryophila, Strain CCMP2564" /LENGTH=264 /DNA_ID=CAMNT_0021256681 /DNA_START=233 /DNA_END=1024 /DNA_ORIENTATION=-
MHQEASEKARPHLRNAGHSPFLAVAIFSVSLALLPFGALACMAGSEGGPCVSARPGHLAMAKGPELQVRTSKSFPSPADAPSLSPQYHERKNSIVSSTSHVVFPSPEERARSLSRATSKQGSQEFEPVSKNGARESKWSDIDKWNDAGSERGISAQARDRVRNVWETGRRRLGSPSADNAASYESKLSEDTHTSTRAHTRTPEDVHTRMLDHSIVLQNFSQAAETREDRLSFDGASESIDRDSAEVGERGGGGRRARARSFEEE